MAEAPGQKPDPPVDVWLGFTVKDAEAIVEDIKALRGATAVEWRTETPTLNKPSNTLILELAKSKGHVVTEDGVLKVERS